MSDLNVPLAAGDDEGSVASKSSLSGSLLERIRAQRGEAASTNPFESRGEYSPVETNPAGMTNAAPTQVQQTATMNNNHRNPSMSSVASSTTGGWSFDFGNWIGHRHSNERAAAAPSTVLEDGNAAAGEALLAPSSYDYTNQQQQQQEYSMLGYFQTFVQDVYSGFRSIHVVGQIVILVVLLFVAFKLL